MVKQIGNYMYNNNMGNIIDVFTHVDGVYVGKAVFEFIGDVVIAQSKIDNPDHAEMRDNAVKIFRGEITE